MQGQFLQWSCFLQGDHSTGKKGKPLQLSTSLASSANLISPQSTPTLTSEWVIYKDWCQDSLITIYTSSITRAGSKSCRYVLDKNVRSLHLFYPPSVLGSSQGYGFQLEWKLLPMLKVATALLRNSGSSPISKKPPFVAAFYTYQICCHVLLSSFTKPVFCFQVLSPNSK